MAKIDEFVILFIFHLINWSLEMEDILASLINAKGSDRVKVHELLHEYLTVDHDESEESDHDDCKSDNDESTNSNGNEEFEMNASEFQDAMRYVKISGEIVTNEKTICWIFDLQTVLVSAHSIPHDKQVDDWFVLDLPKQQHVDLPSANIQYLGSWKKFISTAYFSAWFSWKKQEKTFWEMLNF